MVPAPHSAGARVTDAPRDPFPGSATDPPATDPPVTDRPATSPGSQAALSPLGGGLRGRLHEIIFEADTPAGKAFDVGLLLTILVSIAVVMLESVASIRERHGPLLLQIEWGITVAFTIEYLLRLWTVRSPLRYARSFFGVVDLLAILPTYISPFVKGSQHSFAVIRALRLLRVFRVLKLGHLLGEAQHLRAALQASAHKIFVFLFAVLTLVVVLGAAMYVVEGGESGFTSIPQSIYWAIVTMTTVGYGDVVPHTVLGKFLASIVMILGYGIIAVPTGIVTVALSEGRKVSTQACPDCGSDGHDAGAQFCKDCGSAL